MGGGGREIKTAGAARVRAGMATMADTNRRGSSTGWDLGPTSVTWDVHKSGSFLQ